MATATASNPQQERARNGGSNEADPQRPSGNQKPPVGEEVFAVIKSRSAAFEELAPPGYLIERMLQCFRTAMRKNPDLKLCSGDSLIECATFAATFALYPGPAQEVHFIPRWNSKLKQNEAGPVIDYRGLIKLAKRSGEVKHIWPVLVYAKEVALKMFKQTEGRDRNLIHERYLGDDRGEVVFAYAMAELEGGRFDWEVMSRTQLDKVRGCSKSGIWNSWQEEMEKKSPIRRLCKRLPCGPDVAMALSIEDSFDAAPSEPVDLDKVPSGKRTKFGLGGNRQDGGGPVGPGDDQPATASGGSANDRRTQKSSEANTSSGKRQTTPPPADPPNAAKEARPHDSADRRKTSMAQLRAWWNHLGKTQAGVQELDAIRREFGAPTLLHSSAVNEMDEATFQTLYSRVKAGAETHPATSEADPTPARESAA